MITHITVVGDRQHGKTHILMDQAFLDAAGGATVLYESPLHRDSEEAFYRAEALSTKVPWSSLVHRAWRTRGEERITFHSGGSIIFRSQSRCCATEAWPITVHVLDGTNSQPHPEAQRIYRSALR